MSDFMDRKGGYKTKPREIELATHFLGNFTDVNGHKYLKQLQEISNLERHALEIELDDIQAFSTDPHFAREISLNTKRYEVLFATAAFDLLPPSDPSVSDRRSVYDLWVEIRRQNRSAEEMDDSFRDMATRFEVNFFPFSTQKAYPLRAVRADSVGRLISVRGIVTRVSDVLPLMAVQVYHCKSCGSESYQQVSGREFTPLAQCQSTRCRNNRTRGELVRLDRGSKFRAFQEVRLQELPVEVPVGHIPRTMTVRLYGDALVRTLKPGDVAMISGVFLPAPTNGPRRPGSSRSALVTDTFLEASRIRVAKRSYGAMALTQAQVDELQRMSQMPDILERLARSLCPEIYGHEEVKTALLLSMVGGVTKTTPDGLRIRGDVNVLLVGDPGMAKSQLLKHVVRVAPRAVYTTGKGSSGVGLTAAVVRDQSSGEATLEGGALVLADGGICCIDEFDKMEESDRTAIHEVMEQQTVSIAKAGITTTLNARTTVLAAANPAYGRYNLSRSPSDNLAMPAALLSRFDLLFVLLDRPDQVKDEELAHHVTFVHKHNGAPAFQTNQNQGAGQSHLQAASAYSSEIIRAYISVARQFEPTLSQEASEVLTANYVEQRQATAAQDTRYRSDRSNADEEVNDRARFCTARMLLSTVRVAQAIARIYFSSEVTAEHAESAVRLMHATQAQLNDASATDSERSGSRRQDPFSAIYSIVLRMRENMDTEELNYSMLRDHVLRMGFDEATLERTVEMYANTGVWSLSRNKKTLRFTMEAR